MKAAIHRRYGPPDVLGVEDVPLPAFGPREVLVRVHASTVTSGDARLRGVRAPVMFRWPLRLAFGLRRHGSWRAFWFLIPGIVLLVAGLLVGASHADALHAVLVSLGGTLVALSHLVNLRLNHVHGPDCRH